jgi:hypothetical protein
MLFWVGKIYLRPFRKGILSFFSHIGFGVQKLKIKKNIKMKHRTIFGLENSFEF